MSPQPRRQTLSAGSVILALWQDWLASGFCVGPRNGSHHGAADKAIARVPARIEVRDPIATRECIRVWCWRYWHPAPRWPRIGGKRCC